jgi:hypothetical protein
VIVSRETSVDQLSARTKHIEFQVKRELELLRLQQNQQRPASQLNQEFDQIAYSPPLLKDRVPLFRDAHYRQGSSGIRNELESPKCHLNQAELKLMAFSSGGKYFDTSSCSEGDLYHENNLTENCITDHNN